MNKIINQSGEEIPAIGNDGSFVRNKSVYNITVGKLIEYLWSVEMQGCKPYHTEMEWICEDDNITNYKLKSDLIATANFYFISEKIESDEKNKREGLWR